MKNGRWIGWNNGIKIYEGDFTDGKEDGHWLTYWPISGNKSSEEIIRTACMKAIGWIGLTVARYGMKGITEIITKLEIGHRGMKMAP
jgi:hypothetical protein